MLAKQQPEGGNRLRLKGNRDTDAFLGHGVERAQDGLLGMLGTQQPRSRRDELSFLQCDDRSGCGKRNEKTCEPAAASRPQEGFGLREVARQGAVRTAALQS